MTLAATPAPTSEAARWRRMVPPVLVVGGLAAATLALHLRDPHDQGSWGICPTAAMGLACPGCGGLRAVNDLSNLQFGAAASSNLLFVATIPLFAWVFWRWSAGRWSGRGWDPDSRRVSQVSAALIVVMVVFTVLRNTPYGAWLAP